MGVNTDHQLSKGLQSEIVLIAQHVIRSQRSLILSYQMDSVMYKDDGSPVTIIDKQVEQNIKHELSQHFPQDAIVGEEYGTSNPTVENTANEPHASSAQTSLSSTSQYTWYIDPIDGTFAFINRIPLYTTLLALYHDGQPCFGIIYNPYFDEMLIGITGHGCYLDGEAVNIPHYISHSDRTMLCSDFVMLANAHPLQFQKLCALSHNGRTWCDAYGIIMLVTGRADLMIDFNLKVWDTAALYPIVREAGGWISDFSGILNHNSSTMIACRQNLQVQLLEICNPL